MTKFPNYVSIFKSTGFSSQRYGNCQICDKHVSDVWTLQSFNRGISGKLPWTCRCRCGHQRCLESHIRALGLEVPQEPITLPASDYALES